MGRAANKIAVVTGAASGMGRAHALLLAREGARVIATDRDESNGRETVDEIERDGGLALFIPHDVASETDWGRVIQTAESAYGHVNVLVNNAGIGFSKSTVSTTLEEWESLQHINARGTFLGCREVIPSMKAAGGGSIINVSSTFAVVGRAGFAAYSASKGAVRGMSKALAAELAEFKIRVNSIYPGTIETNLTKHVLSSPEAIKEIIGPQLIRRPGLPSEVASAVLFLASEESSFVTGAELLIDGGYTSV
jgi:cyclopentanol dehydrogenase